MKFIKIIINSTNEELDEIISEFDSVSLSVMTKLYQMQQFIEFDLEDGRGIMFAGMEDHQIEELIAIYVKYGINFSFEDITKSILFGEIPNFEKQEKFADLKALIDIFIDENLDTDVVLDKISEMGMESISERDKKLLAQSA